MELPANIKLVVYKYTSLIEDIVTIVVNYLPVCVDCKYCLYEEHECNCGRFRCKLHQYYNTTYSDIICTSTYCHTTEKMSFIHIYDDCKNIKIRNNGLQYCKYHLSFIENKDQLVHVNYSSNMKYKE